MKTTRSWQYLWRLTKWRELYADLGNMPILSLEREISIEEAKRMFPGIGVHVGYTVYTPIKVEVTP